MSLQDPLQEADRCVKCGLCLPHCPTYWLLADEGDSPRGRIALMQGWLGGSLADTPRLRAHLDRCLVCRACETACPSGVRYGALIAAARGEQRRRKGAWRRWADGLLPGLIARLPYGPWPVRLAALYRGLGLQVLVRRFGPPSLRRLDGLLPARLDAPSLRGFYPAQGKPRRRVALFTGCVGRLADRGALEAAVRLLPRLGVEVVIPPEQACCGALHHHAGDAITAERLAERNRRVFSALEAEALVGVASGCVAHLRAHARLPLHSEEIGRLLTDLEWPQGLRPRPLRQRVAVHLPCTQIHSLRDADSTLRLLGRIPEIDLITLPENGRCCGGAGAYLLRQPRIAEALRAHKIELLRESGATLLVTTNTGCALHLAAGIQQAGLGVELLHPLELLARQLE